MKLKILSIFFFVCLLNTSNSDSISDNDAYALEQSINDFHFRVIGTINLRQLKQNQNSAQLQTLNEQQNSQAFDSENRGHVYQARIESNDFDQEILSQIKTSQADPNALYRLRLCKKLANSQVCYASTFAFLKNVIESGFRLNLTVHVNSNNRPNALSIKTSSPENQKRKNVLDHLSVWANIQSVRIGQQPDTETYLEKVRKEMEQKQKGDQGENQSFLSKYWIYIVPFVVIMFLMNIVNPEGADQSA